MYVLWSKAANHRLPHLKLLYKYHRGLIGLKNLQSLGLTCWHIGGHPKDSGEAGNLSGNPSALSIHSLRKITSLINNEQGSTLKMDGFYFSALTVPFLDRSVWWSAWTVPFLDRSVPDRTGTVPLNRRPKTIHTYRVEVDQPKMDQ